MKLRQRIVLTLVGITVVLAIPAAYGLVGLRAVHDITDRLSQQRVATSTLGDLRNAAETALDGQRRYVAVFRVSSVLDDTTTAQDTSRVRIQVDSAIQSAVRALGVLRTQNGGEYARATVPAAETWSQIAENIRRERGLLAAREDAADTLRLALEDQFAVLEPRLDAIESTIVRRTGDELDEAERIAKNAASTTLLALALSLAATLLIGTLLTRTLLRPIALLRQGMGSVAEGDFEPHVRIPRERPDELGDLARSFGTMTEQLRELDRLKAEFVSVASHEIKTPLSVIRGYVTLLADGIYGDVNDQQKKTLEAVSAQTDRLTRLVHRLLDVSRFEAGGARLELRQIELRPFFDELTEDFRVLAVQNGIEFPVRLADDLPRTLVGDEDRLNEVLGNLLSNAFKFTAKGGTIRVDAARCDGGIQVEVEDTGVGIPPDKLPHVFEKFYQVDNEAQPRSVGSGLGLAIAREIVEAHGGTIGAESQVGRGTRFRVYLPERPPAAAGHA
ncbi:HAMP domain-containing sensor histidine kinase [Longimicrobium sp.]|uniref:sensor histidine kinase n=1 Tax=Longimicrobium sp. TaxID=2029185 RepID=UPI002E351553|nr:HAMP domain-containing sensor histidine kinase [Longimicrobium sp.]HEX6040111.1 HAMP domain-containing sensor histidine kinase [Longimicrobium sp.]